MKKWLITIPIGVGLILLWTWSGEEKPISPITFQEIEEAVMDSDLTEIQEEAVHARYIGERIRWTGEVSGVSKKGLVSVDIDGMASDVEFYLSKAAALELSEGQEITFVGTIEALDIGMFDCDVRLGRVILE